MESIWHLVLVGIGCGILVVALDNLWNKDSVKSRKRFITEILLVSILIIISAYLIAIFAFGVIIEVTK